MGEFPLLCGPRTETRLCVLAARASCHGLLVMPQLKQPVRSDVSVRGYLVILIAAEHAPDQLALAAVVHLNQLEGPPILILR